METYSNYLTKGQAAVKLFISFIVTMIFGLIFSLVLDIEIPQKCSDVFSFIVYDIWPYEADIVDVMPNINYTLCADAFEWTARISAYSIIVVLALTVIYNLVHLIWSAAVRCPEYASGRFIKTVRALYSVCTYISAIFLFAASYIFMIIMIADMCGRRKVFLIWFILLTAVLGGIMIARIVMRIAALRAGEAENIGSYAVTLILAMLPVLCFFAVIIGAIILGIRLFIFSNL